MAALTDDQIATFAKSGGFTGDDIGIAVRIAKAESGGNPKAHNSKPPDDSYGLWQINMYGKLGPARRKQYNLSNNEQLYDPTTNARVAYGIYKASGWTAWTTYTSGAYTKVAVDTIADAALKGFQESIKPNDPLTEALSKLANMKNSVDDFGKTFLKAVESFSGLLLGIALLIVGIVILLRRQIGGAAGAVKKIPGVP